MSTEPTTAVLTSTLTPLEKQHLAAAEAIIERGKQVFVGVGVALTEIRDSRLYREDHASFENYCKKRWGFGRAHAYRFIDAAAVAIELSPMGDTPTCERQVRPLTKLEPEQRIEAWSAAKEAAASEGRAVTTHDVEVAVEVMEERPRVKTATEESTDEKFTCDSCDESFDDDSEAVTLYECGDCGEKFTQETSSNGKHSCPSCNKFGAKVSDMGCPSCNEGELNEPAYIQREVDQLIALLEKTSAIARARFIDWMKSEAAEVCAKAA